MRTFTRSILMIGGGIALTVGIALSVNADDAGAIKYRQAVMKVVGGHMGASVAIIKGQVPYKDDLLVHARGLDHMAKLVANAFEQETFGGKTRAKDDIWEDADGFNEKVEAFKEATAAFLSAAESGGPEAAGAKLGPLGETCKGCHKKYRAKKS